MSYQPGVPTGSVPFNQDYLNIQQNFTQINTQFNVDHVPLTSTSGTPPNGYHTVVHLAARSTTATNPATNYPPTAITPVTLTGELFSTQSNDGIGTDEILWYQTGAGKLMQLTSNFVPVANTTGRTFLPGGLIMQWGTLTAASQTLTPVTFVGLGGIAFTSGAFNAQASIKEGASSGANVLNISNLTVNGFSYYNTSSIIRDYFWMVIGK